MAQSTQPFYEPELETMSREQLRALQETLLRRQVERCYAASALYRSKLEAVGAEPGDVRGLDDLARLPVVTKAELREDQLVHPPFGTFAVAEPAEDAEHQPAARVGRVDAVVLQLRPGPVLAHPLIHAIRLDQPQERLARQVELPNRRLDVPQHRPRRLTGEGRIDLLLELVERREPIAVVRVPQLVDEPRVAVERPDVRAQRARKKTRADREVLAGGAVITMGQNEFVVSIS